MDREEDMYQLWVEWDRDAKYEMIGFFDSRESAKHYALEMRQKVETPCVGDWRVVRVRGWK